ncbi:hypothetical protein JD844_019154 [Phrynosoma platyrhinos]|uniref:Transcription elongation factor A protein 2 n=1 Tax=Phrynosoma platyrhinos TaxID=52577 RepID=A0ABQ7SPJ5_PHRPL|nr:hypothetical protein JD844_019154 [Phrynosoma platyrhinos]
MGGEEEIVRIAKRLDKMVAKKNAEGAMDLLKELKSMPITLDLLQSTRIGMSVNALRKQSTDEDVITLAKSLIKAWKKLLDASEDKSDEKKKNSSLPTSSSKESGDSKDQRMKGYLELVSDEIFQALAPDARSKVDVHINVSTKRQDPPKTPTTPKMTTFPPVPVTCDTVRNKCREMLTSALQTDIFGYCLVFGYSDWYKSYQWLWAQTTTAAAAFWKKPRAKEFAEAESTVSDITPPSGQQEKSLVIAKKEGQDSPEASDQSDDYVTIGADYVKNTDLKYKNRVRSRLSNLKDSKNPDLRKNVLCGVITAEQIAVMTSEEMASNELKEIRKAMTKEAIREHQMAKTGGTQTDLFTCGKCKKKNCTYTQVQTRSSDEPMTTFVVCNECGNRWKVKRAQLSAHLGMEEQKLGMEVGRVPDGEFVWTDHL